MTVSLAACSSSSKKSSTSPTSGGGSSASGSPIKVGEICSCSGEPGFSEFSVPAEQSVQAWAKGINASGGIDGHPIQLITKDDGTNPGTSLTDAQSLISDHVVAIIDDTTLIGNWASDVESAKIPVVGNYTINTPFSTSPDFFAEGQTNDTTLNAVTAIAKQAGATKIGNMYCAEAPVCAQSVPYVQAAGKAAGIPDVYNVSISATAPNFTAQCLAAKQAGVNALFIGDASVVIDHVAGNCAAQGYKPVYITEGAGFGLAQASSPGLTNSLWTQYADVPFWDTSLPGVQAYDTLMNKYFPGVVANNSTYTEDAFMAYVSGLLLEDGIKDGGLTAASTPSAAEVITGLTSLKGDTLDGLAPPLTFVAGQPNPQKCYFVGHIVGGKPVMANNGQPECVGSTS